MIVTFVPTTGAVAVVVVVLVAVVAEKVWFFVRPSWLVSVLRHPVNFLKRIVHVCLLQSSSMNLYSVKSLCWASIAKHCIHYNLD